MRGRRLPWLICCALERRRPERRSFRRVAAARCDRPCPGFRSHVANNFMPAAVPAVQAVTEGASRRQPPSPMARPRPAAQPGASVKICRSGRVFPELLRLILALRRRRRGRDCRQRFAAIPCATGYWPHRSRPSRRTKSVASRIVPRGMMCALAFSTGFGEHASENGRRGNDVGGRAAGASLRLEPAGSAHSRQHRCRRPTSTKERNNVEPG